MLVVDDVMTAGTAIREAFDILAKEGATPAGVVIALDRQVGGRFVVWYGVVWCGMAWCGA